MKRLIIITIYLLYAIAALCQSNNAIFNGGFEDGWASKNYQQPENNIFNGGDNDGWSGKNFRQLEINIFKGGIGDGWAKDTVTYHLKISDIENNFESNLSVYPNPTTKSIQIELDRFYDSLITEIFTLDGRKVQHKEFNNVNSINLEIDTEPGIYFIKLLYNHKAVSVKVIKQ